MRSAPTSSKSSRSSGPTGIRYSGAWAYEGDRWYERSAHVAGHQPQQARHHAGSHVADQGRDLVRRLVRDADVVVENFSPRVIEQFGLDYESLVAAQTRRDPGAHAGVRPGGAVARLRRLGAQHRADIGHVGGHRLRRRAAVQPAGTRRPHRRCARRGRAARRARASAPHRRRPTHRGRADRGRGVRHRRAGDRILDERRRPAARGQPPSRSSCRASIRPPRTTRGWRCACATTPTGRSWSRRWGDPTCSSGFWRTTSSTRWSPIGRGPRTAADIVDALGARHVPAEQVLTADGCTTYPNSTRGDSTKSSSTRSPARTAIRVGRSRSRLDPARHHRFAPPTLGQHNEEILRGLGLTDDELDDLRARHVIGETALNA